MFSFVKIREQSSSLMRTTYHLRHGKAHPQSYLMQMISRSLMRTTYHLH